MNSLKKDGVVQIAINDDPNQVISFVPDDVLFAERFYQLLNTLKIKEVDYKKRAEVLSKNNTVDEYGIPETAPERLALMHELCDFMRDEIDKLFGEGTSQKVFGEYLSLYMIEQFFKGLLPYVQISRQEKTRKYTDPVKARREIEIKKSLD